MHSTCKKIYWNKNLIDLQNKNPVKMKIIYFIFASYNNRVYNKIRGHEY